MTEKVQRIRRNILIESLKHNSIKGRLLDIGCQDGDMCYLMHQEGFEVCGVDIDRERIIKAKQKYQQIEFKYADCGNKIPFSDDFFDVVWAGDVIEHICNTDIFVNEINRVLKVRGLFALSTPAHDMIKKHFDPEFPHYRFYTLKSLKNVLEKRGFRIIKVKFGFCPINHDLYKLLI